MSKRTLKYCSYSTVALGMAVALTSVASLADAPDATPAAPSANVSQAEVDATTLARPPAPWVDARVLEARDRLTRTAAGQLIWAAIEAHGGLERWYLNGPLSFRYVYRPLDGRPARDTLQVVDTWSSRARHSLIADDRLEFGWDGRQAWIRQPPDTEAPVSNVRFWSLTPYYFVAAPFVLADPGTLLTLDGEAELAGRTYDLVRVTFEPDTGDAPDDYYVVYVDRETHQLGALRYVVSYPGFFPQGGHSPEKLMTYEEVVVIGGISLAQRSRFYAWDGESLGEQVTEATVSELSFAADVPSSYFDVPADATVLPGW